MSGITLALDKAGYGYGEVIHWTASGFCEAGATCGSGAYTQHDQMLIYAPNGLAIVGTSSFSNCPEAFEDVMYGSLKLVHPYGPAAFISGGMYKLRLMSTSFGVQNLLAEASFQYTTSPAPGLWSRPLNVASQWPRDWVTTTSFSRAYAEMMGNGYTPGGALVVKQFGPTPTTVKQYQWGADSWGSFNLPGSGVYFPSEGTYVFQAIDVSSGAKSNIIVVTLGTPTFDPTTVVDIADPRTYPLTTTPAEEVHCPPSPTSKPVLDPLPENVVQPAPILLSGHDFVPNRQVNITIAGGGRQTVQADGDGKISSSIPTANLALGWHDIIACNAPIVSSGSSFFCPKGQSNTVGTKLTLFPEPHQDHLPFAVQLTIICGLTRIQSAKVTMDNGLTLMTDNWGQVTFWGISKGRHYYKVIAAGYGEHTYPIEVSADIWNLGKNICGHEPEVRLANVTYTVTQGWPVPSVDLALQQDNLPYQQLHVNPADVVFNSSKTVQWELLFLPGTHTIKAVLTLKNEVGEVVVESSSQTVSV